MKVQFHSQKSKEPERESGMQVPYGAAKRRRSKWRWYLIVLLVTSPLIWILWNMGSSLLFVRAQGFISLGSISVNSTSLGLVEQLTVSIGQKVAKGDVVATLYNADLETQRELFRSELATLGANAGVVSQKKKDLLRKQIMVSESTLSRYGDRLNSVNFLFEQRAATAAEIEVAEEEYSKAAMDLVRARFELEDYLERSGAKKRRLPDVEQESRRQKVLAQLKALEEKNARLLQKSPYNGRVLDIFVGAGEMVSPGIPLLIVGQEDKPKVIAYLNPRYVSYAQKGRKATVTLPDGKKIGAIVDEDAVLSKILPSHLVSPLGSRDMMLVVYLSLSSPLPAVQWVDGLPVDVRFHYSW